MKNLFLIIVSCFFMSSAGAGLEEIFGNADAGDSCRSDYQCESLCCNKNIGICGSHNPSAEEPRFCNKPAGESCITSEFCATYDVVVCNIYKTGTNADGSLACIMRCPVQMARGTCVNDACRAPRQLPVPPFDPSDCSKAVDP